MKPVTKENLLEAIQKVEKQKMYLHNLKLKQIYAQHTSLSSCTTYA
mgnify:CR=1 FL=1